MNKRPVSYLQTDSRWAKKPYRVPGESSTIGDSGCGPTAKDGKWSSAKLRAGAWHKGGMILIVCIALVADWLIGTLLHNLPAVELPFTYSVLLGPLVIVWYVIGELGSLAEHAVTMGASRPKWLDTILNIVRDAIDNAGETFTENNPDGDHKN